MDTTVLHAGFDGLKVNVDTVISMTTRKAMADAKEIALDQKSPVPVTIGGLEFAVRHTGNRAFSIHTGDYGAEFFLHDPESVSGIGPGVTMDFRAFFLATEGLEGARAYFDKTMTALGVKFQPDQMRVSRVDFAVDFLAPWFEPDTEAVVLAARTSKRESREKDSRETFFANTEVTGITCGHVSNRQLVMYDKRAEVIGKRKPGWLVIWNQNRELQGQPKLDLSDNQQSRIWRFENRVGSKCLRRRWEIKSWSDLDAMIGDVFDESLKKMSYRIPSQDSNRSRWAEHELWKLLRAVYRMGLARHRSGVVPNEVREVNRAEHQRMLDQNILGNLIARAVSAGIGEKHLWGYARLHINELERASKRESRTIGERVAKAEGKYRFR